MNATEGQVQLAKMGNGAKTHIGYQPNAELYGKCAIALMCDFNPRFRARLIGPLTQTKQVTCTKCQKHAERLLKENLTP